MDSVLTLIVTTTLSSVALALFLRFRRERSSVVNTVLALLASLCLWSAGIGLAHTADAGLGATALRIALLGMFATSGLWLLLALRHRWPRQTSGMGATALAFGPALIFFGASLADTGHGWVLLPEPRFCPHPVHWSGPLTWALLVPAQLADIAGTLIFLSSALRLWRRGERVPALAIGIALLATPIGGMMVYLGHITVTFPIVPALRTLSLLVLALTLLRYQMVEPPPIGHREVIDHLRDGVLIANPSGEILDYNAAAELALGRAPDGESIAGALEALAAPDRREALRTALAAPGELSEPVSLQLECRDGRHLEVSIHSIRSDREDEGDSLGQVALLRDRTAERRYAEAALRTEKLETVGTLAAGIAHELNNPLAFVRANLGEVARMAEVVDAQRQRGGSALADDLGELRELAQDASEGLKRIQQAISDVRGLAATPGGMDEVSLDTVVLEAVRLVELRAGNRVEVESRLAHDLPSLRGSRQLLSQAVLNLLLNAQQALEGVDEPRIQVETGAEPEALWLRVRDNGPGVPEVLREAIFKPFFTTARERGCRGLGLSVASDIAREHGGSLCVEPCDEGASFVLRVACHGRDD